MPNVPGVITPDIIARDILAAIHKMIPVFGSFMMDYSDEVLHFGQTAKVKTPVAPTVRDRDADGAYTAADMQFVDTDVTIDQWDHITVNVTQKERSSWSRDIYSQYIEEQAKELMSAFAQYVFGIAGDPAKFPLEYVCTAANMSREQWGKLRRVIKAQNQKGPFNGILNGDYFDELDNDVNVRDRNLTDAQVNFPEGVIAGLKGTAAIYEWENLPTANNLGGIISNKRALAIAQRLPDEGDEAFAELVGNGGIIRKVGQEGGFRILYRLWKNWDNGDIKMTVTHMYGAQPLDTTALVRAVSVATV